MTNLNYRFFLSLALLTLFLLPTLAYAQDETKLVLNVLDTQLDDSLQPFIVTIAVESSPDVYGIETHLKFDPQMLEVVDFDTEVAGVQVQPGTFIDPTEPSVFVLQNQADNQAGTLDYSLALVAPAPAVRGGGELMSVTFRPKLEGRTTIEVVDSLLVSPNVAEISHTTEALRIVIGSPFNLSMLLWLVLGLLLLLLLLFVAYQARSIRRLRQNQQLAQPAATQRFAPLPQPPNLALEVSIESCND